MTFHSIQTTVLVEDLRVDAIVGHHAPERDQAQIISIDLSCTLMNAEVPGDELENSFDYVPIVDEIKAFALSRSRRLIETFAEEIAEACFNNPRVQTVVVSVRKPHKLPAVKAVGVTRTFERNS